MSFLLKRLMPYKRGIQIAIILLNIIQKCFVLHKCRILVGMVAEVTKTKHVFFCRYFDFRLSGRRHENTKYSRRNNDILTGEGTKISLLKISCRRMEISCCRPCLSCFRVFASKREVEVTTKRHVFVSSLFAFRGEDTKTRNGINQPPYI